MAITLTRLSTGAQLTLSSRLLWTDEHKAWRRAVQVEHGTDGSLHLHERLRQAGRPITLDGRASKAWTTRADFSLLLSWSELLGETFSLVLRGVARNVVFHAGNGPAVDADDAWALEDGEHSADAFVLPVLAFIEV